MKFNNAEALLIVILCITSVIDTVVSILTYIRG